MTINKNQRLTISALLIAIGILIPMFSPVRFMMEPVSFTLGSHVAIFIALFISPGVAVSVALGTAFGFFIGGFPIVIVLRALSHVVFALVGALILKKKPDILQSPVKAQIFSLGIGIIHGLCEVIVVAVFYFTGNMAGSFYSQGFVQSIILLVGLGSVVHSMIDFGISYIIWRGLIARRSSSLVKRD
ncbi:hypothetical protein ACWOFR_11950 [Carnobacterium gallinarum]|uniref:hypothetical protein n=1 Tax=Carnobacterium gallinarum TaxID=2749 RepID=UPI000555D4B9|nr:hypothetical protein [Carnobacterium gallinarum]